MNFVLIILAGLLEIAASSGITPHSGDLQQVFLFPFVRQGQRRDTLVLTAGSSFQTPTLKRGTAGCVSLVAGMPFNLGDGAELTIQLVDAQRQQPVVHLLLDPAHVRAQRAWVPIRFDIAPGLDNFSLRFEVGPGVRGDSTGDWIGLAGGPEAGCLFSERNRP